MGEEVQEHLIQRNLSFYLASESEIFWNWDLD